MIIAKKKHYSKSNAFIYNRSISLNKQAQKTGYYCNLKDGRELGSTMMV